MPPSAALSEYLQRHPDFRDRTSSASRLPSLYSDFGRHRQSDPASFRSNVEWWRAILTETLRLGLQEDRSVGADAALSTASASKGKSRETASSRLSLKVDESLKDRWTLNDVGRPLSLGDVIVGILQPGQASR